MVFILYVGQQDSSSFTTVTPARVLQCAAVSINWVEFHLSPLLSVKLFKASRAAMEAAAYYRVCSSTEVETSSEKIWCFKSDAEFWAAIKCGRFNNNCKCKNAKHDHSMAGRQKPLQLWFYFKNMHKYTNKSSWNCFYIECDKTDKLKVHLLTYSWQLSHTAGSVSMFVCLFQPKILMQIDQQLHKCLRFSPHFNFLSWSFHVRWNALNGQKCVDIQTLLPSVVIIITHQMLQPAAELRRLVN